MHHSAAVARPDRCLPHVTRAFAAALFAAVVLVPAAGTHSVREGGTFRVGIQSDVFDSIDPVVAQGVGSFIVGRASCETLMGFPDQSLPEGYRVVPQIAQDYPKITDGRKTYTFTIRKGLRFSTGAPVTARSVAHTINRALSPKMGSALATSFTDIVGAQQVIDGEAETASGVVARGNTLVVRLTRPVGAMLVSFAALCVVPETTPIDPEGLKAPAPSAGPYYFSQFVLGQRAVLERNRFYHGSRPHHVDRMVVDLTGDTATVLDRVDRGELDYGWVPNQAYGERADEFRRKFGVNKTRFFAVPGNNLRMFVLNTSRPLFRNNPQLRQAINFAVDRKALLRERGPLAGTPTDQYLPPGFPAFRNERIYPLDAPDVGHAKKLAKGRLRGGKAVLYVPSNPVGTAQAEVLKANLRRIGLDLEVKAFPAPVLFEKLATPGEPFDIGWIGWIGIVVDGSFLNLLFDGSTIGTPGFFGDYSYFNSTKYNALLHAASRLPLGPKRYETYAKLDVDISRNAAPGIPFAYDNTLTLVGPRTSCIVLNPELDVTAVCLK